MASEELLDVFYAKAKIAWDSHLGDIGTVDILLARLIRRRPNQEEIYPI